MYINHIYPGIYLFTVLFTGVLKPFVDFQHLQNRTNHDNLHPTPLFLRNCNKLTLHLQTLKATSLLAVYCIFKKNSKVPMGHPKINKELWRPSTRNYEGHPLGTMKAIHSELWRPSTRKQNLKSLFQIGVCHFITWKTTLKNGVETLNHQGFLNLAIFRGLILSCNGWCLWWTPQMDILECSQAYWPCLRCEQKKQLTIFWRSRNSNPKNFYAFFS